MTLLSSNHELSQRNAFLEQKIEELKNFMVEAKDSNENDSNKNSGQVKEMQLCFQVLAGIFSERGSES